MPWFAISDGAAFHRKILKAGNEAIGAWARAGSWSSAPENLTEGWIPAEVADSIAPARVWERLIGAGMLDRDDRGGYSIRSYLEYNPSAEDVRDRREELRQKRSDAGKKGNAKRWGSRPPSQDASHNASQNDRKTIANYRPLPLPLPLPRSSDPLLRAPARVESTPEGPSAPEAPLELTLSETFAAEEAKPVGDLDALARSLAAEGNPFGQRCAGYLDGGQALPSAMREKLREILAERAKPRPSGHRRVSVTAEEQALVAVYVAALKQIRREEVPQLELHALAARRILPDLVTLAKSIARDDFFPTPADVLAHKLETYLRLNDQRLAAEGYPLGLVLARTDASDLPRPPKRARPAAQRDGPRAAEEPRPTIRYAGRGYDDEQAKSATGS